MLPLCGCFVPIYTLLASWSTSGTLQLASMLEWPDLLTTKKSSTCEITVISVWPAVDWMLRSLKTSISSYLWWHPCSWCYCFLAIICTVALQLLHCTWSVWLLAVVPIMCSAVSCLEILPFLNQFKNKILYEEKTSVLMYLMIRRKTCLSYCFGERY